MSLEDKIDGRILEIQNAGPRDLSWDHYLNKVTFDDLYKYLAGSLSDEDHCMLLGALQREDSPQADQEVGRIVRLAFNEAVNDAISTAEDLAFEQALNHAIATNPTLNGWDGEEQERRRQWK